MIEDTYFLHLTQSERDYLLKSVSFSLGYFARSKDNGSGESLLRKVLDTEPSELVNLSSGQG